MSPKVSVIIPNYNHAQFLEKRLDSVLNQTFQDLEVIFLDDASSDNSKAVFAAYGDDPRITQTIFNSTNSGSPFKQWNKGAKAASGEYLWIAESDDFADERFLEVLVGKLEQNPRAGLAYCQSWMVDETHQILGNYASYTDEIDPQRWRKDYGNNGQDECRRYLIFKNTIPNASAVVMRRSLFEQVGQAQEHYRICGDWFLWFNILLLADVEFVAEPLNAFRIQLHHSMRHTAKKQGVEVEETFDMFQLMAQRLELSEQELNQALHHHTRVWFYIDSLDRIPWSRIQRIYRCLNQISPSFAKQALPRYFWKRLRRTTRRYLWQKVTSLKALPLIGQPLSRAYRALKDSKA